MFEPLYLGYTSWSQARDTCPSGHKPRHFGLRSVHIFESPLNHDYFGPCSEPRIQVSLVDLQQLLLSLWSHSSSQLPFCAAQSRCFVTLAMFRWATGRALRTAFDIRLSLLTLQRFLVLVIPGKPTCCFPSPPLRHRSQPHSPGVPAVPAKTSKMCCPRRAMWDLLPSSAVSLCIHYLYFSINWFF